MPIQVTCPGCKATFNVSEKFAGKQGPCPKCKAPITIPKLAPAAASGVGAKGAAAGPPPEVKIHAPEEVQKTGKTKTGHPTAKPLLRSDARLTPKLLVLVTATMAVLFVGAYFGGEYVEGPRQLRDDLLSDPAAMSSHRMSWIKAIVLRAVVLLVAGWPIVLAGYAVLRDDELEPYRGRSLQIRLLFCLVAYLAAWGIYAAIPDDLKRETYLWVLLAPVVIVPAAIAAYFTLDLDFLGSTIHTCFFLLVTLMLGWTAGLSMPWQPPPDERLAPPPSDVKLEVIYK